MRIRFILKFPNAYRTEGRQCLLPIFHRIKMVHGKQVKTKRWEVSISNLIKGSLLVGVVYYFSFALFAKQWIDHKLPLNQIAYQEIINPLEWSNLPSQIGRAHIEEAYKSLASNNYKNALLRLRSGLRRNPSNQNARFTLAQFYFRIGAPDLGLALLDEVWERDEPVSRKYLISQFQAARYFHAFDYAERLAENAFQHTPSTEADPNFRDIIFEELFTVFEIAKDYESIITWSDRWRALSGKNPTETSARIDALWQLERAETGFAELKMLSAELRDTVEVRRASLSYELQIQEPEDVPIFAMAHECWSSTEFWPIQVEMIKQLGEQKYDDLSLKCIRIFLNQPQEKHAVLNLFRALTSNGLIVQVEFLANRFSHRDDALDALLQKYQLVTLLELGEIERAKGHYLNENDTIKMSLKNDASKEWFEFVFADQFPNTLPDSIKSNLFQVSPNNLRLSAKVFAKRERHDLAAIALDAAIEQRPTDSSLTNAFKFHDSQASANFEKKRLNAAEIAQRRMERSVESISDQVLEVRYQKSASSRGPEMSQIPDMDEGHTEDSSSEPISTLD